MEKRAEVHTCLSLPQVEEETRDADLESAIHFSRFQIAEELALTHPAFRRSLVREAETIIGPDDRAHLGNGFGDDPRRTIHLTTVVGGQTFLGTGAIIAPRLVLTAAHVCRPLGTSPDRIVVRPAAHRQGNEHDRAIFPFGEQASTVTRVHPRYIHSDQHRANFDVGVIALPDDTLYRRIGKRFGLVAISDAFLNTFVRGSREARSFSPLGYPGDKELYSMWYHPFARALSFDRLTIQTDADIVPGCSGTAIVTNFQEIAGQIFGVVVAETANFNIIKRIDDESFGHIQGWMNEFA